ncbi:hypothetical protein BDR04DRAFT_1089781 [Suillus decipiens]|nr:hypothetical protein BDR04DRAFT_1089781 [Suillus decipiens]
MTYCLDVCHPGCWLSCLLSCAVVSTLRRVGGLCGQSLVAQQPHTHFCKTTNIVTAANIHIARVSPLPALCTDKYRCCRSNNNGEDGEIHFLCGVLWNLLRGILNDISEDGGTL